MKKAFFINGGAGRVLCAIPALEYYAKNIDKDVVIIVEGWYELMLMSKTLSSNIYPNTHKDLMKVLKNREIITPEPYRLNAYFNQKCNLIQAFDMLINYKTVPRKIPDTKHFNTFISKSDTLFGKDLVYQAKNALQKDKVIIFQPLGSGAELKNGTIIDESGRSIELEDIITLTRKLAENYAIIIMGTIDIPVDGPMGAMVPSNINLLQWSSVINEADYFIGCDSVGQHLANAVKKPSTVIIGSTFPENKEFKIIDKGAEKRIYSPIRITSDLTIERNNESLMKMEEIEIDNIVTDIKNKLGKNNFIIMQENQQQSCCGNC